MAIPNPQADPCGFVRRLYAAEFHWFFVQGVAAINKGLIVPGASSILNGIEASLQFYNCPTGKHRPERSSITVQSP